MQHRPVLAPSFSSSAGLKTGSAEINPHRKPHDFLGIIEDLGWEAPLCNSGVAAIGYYILSWGGVGWGGQWAVGGGRTENSLHLKYQPQQISSITLSAAQ